MTLQQDWQMESKANTITSIFGYDENGDTRRSAIPLFFDEWFHGDFRTNRPDDLSNALVEKSLEEYARQFPTYRINSVVEIGFDTSDGETISGYEVQMTDPDDSATSGELAPITLEGGSDEPDNPFRNRFDHYDDSQDDDFLPASQKGPYTAIDDDFQITDSAGNAIDGVRASLIFGGSDAYLEKVKEDITDLTELVNHDVAYTLALYFSNLPAFYTFIDFAFMADGAKAIRVWDASRYPAHALYLDDQKVGQNAFRENIEWTTNGAALENQAFNKFAIDGQIAGATPFGKGSIFGYEIGYSIGTGEHPVMRYTAPGDNLSGEIVADELPNPLFPV